MFTCSMLALNHLDECYHCCYCWWWRCCLAVMASYTGFSFSPVAGGVGDGYVVDVPPPTDELTDLASRVYEKLPWKAQVL